MSGEVTATGRLHRSMNKTNKLQFIALIKFMMMPTRQQALCRGLHRRKRVQSARLNEESAKHHLVGTITSGFVQQ